MTLAEPVKYQRKERKHYPLGYTPAKTIYDWLGREIEKAKLEMVNGSDEILIHWIAKCQALRVELKAKHRRSKDGRTN